MAGLLDTSVGPLTTGPPIRRPDLMQHGYTPERTWWYEPGLSTAEKDRLLEEALARRVYNRNIAAAPSRDPRAEEFLRKELAQRARLDAAQ